jgi:hypothetical protein
MPNWGEAPQRKRTKQIRDGKNRGYALAPGTVVRVSRAPDVADAEGAAG